MTRLACAAYATLGMLLVTNLARADTIVITPAKRSALIADEVEDRIVEAIRGELAGLQEKLRVIPPLLASETVPEAQGCFTIACALKYRATFQADFVVQISIFERDGKASSFNIVLVESEDVQYRAGTVIDSSNLEALTRSVFKQARDKQLRGPGPWLIVRTSQSGALVSMDDSVLGLTPLYATKIEPGDHVVRVKKDGFEPWSQTLTVSEGADVERVLEAQLELSGKATPRAATLRQRRTWADWALGLAGVAVGATYFFDGLRMTWREGDCADYGLRDADGQLACRERYAVTTGTKLRMIGGALGMAAGTAVAWAAPIGWMYHRDHRGTVAGLTYKGDF